MRKLSSSPHLLGICEEGEDVESIATLLPSSQQGNTRANRSASTGLVHIQHGITQSTKNLVQHSQPTYSSVRMVRPRQAVVSQELCKRYDQHKKLIARARRSTSCSSSEASDDEEGKRLSLLGSKYCCGKRDRNNDDGDDNFDGQGGVGVSGNYSGDVERDKSSASGGTSGTSSDRKLLQERRSGGASEECFLLLHHLFFQSSAINFYKIDLNDLYVRLIYSLWTAVRFRSEISRYTASYWIDISTRIHSYNRLLVVRFESSVLKTICSNDCHWSKSMFTFSAKAIPSRVEIEEQSGQDLEWMLLYQLY
ncbi:hypothetical protein DICVIV_00293 [Dictyocaulus viviparus]|uniref:Uncharacterized protein n=1 Tax=Dictyocaulus viviparus TaxID=29172 RepID=A0A0D8Y9M0_DICVI|nr:hypothetical protein DICVIV_00293 [Dictyocaulus viviparus]